MIHLIWTAVSTNIGYLFAAVAGFFIKWLTIRINERTGKLHPTIAANYVLSKELYRLARECGIRVGASRCYVTLYKNGEHYASGNAIFRAYRVQEWDADNVLPVKDKYQGVMASFVTDETALILAIGPAFTPVSTLPLGTFRSMCIRDGATAIARVAIPDEKHATAFLGCDFSTTAAPDNLSEMVRYAGLIQLALAKPQDDTTISHDSGDDHTGILTQ